MTEFVKDNVILARLIEKSDINDGLNFFSNDNEYIQVGVWSNYDEGKALNRHIHNEFDRISKRTYEVLYVISGSIESELYDLSGLPFEKVVVTAGNILILLECGHGYKILENGTRVLEVKNGPYLGANKDRIRF